MSLIFFVFLFAKIMILFLITRFFSDYLHANLCALCMAAGVKKFRTMPTSQKILNMLSKEKKLSEFLD